MQVGKAIFDILTNNAAVLAITSDGGTDPRIFPSRFDFPKDVQTPYITYQIVSQEPNNIKSGPSLYDYVSVQINLYSTSYSSLITLSGKVRTALDYVSGTFQGVDVDKIFFQNQNELFDDSAGQQGFYGIAQDYRFNINN
tara:strand:- start:185 stop:604 length:420 start_codon:yes stop_codon:yes gene_type:complete